MRRLSFSDKNFTVDLLENVKNMEVREPTILLNINDTAAHVDSEILQPLSSSIFNQVTIPHAGKMISITSVSGFSALESLPDRDRLMKEWTHVHDIFPLPHLSETKLWRSKKEKIGNVSFNLWFAAAGTDCGIHNEHDFLEIHTQIWGTGHMQKFHTKDSSTMYEDILMTPGFTHEPFCGQDHLYPWHRYFADTDCVWLAVEWNKQ